MLKNLFIRNIILIDKVDITFSDGFCVLTGETGAGKSILLGALGLALGKRVAGNVIRAGQSQASVTAVFDASKAKSVNEILTDAGLDSEEGDELYLRRVIYSDGKSKAFVNDSPVSISLLSKLAENLIEIHGQNDHRGLMDAKTHLNILDQYGDLGEILVKTKLAFDSYKSLYNELEELSKAKEKAKENQDYLQYVLKELEDIAPSAGEEEKLAAKRNRLINRDKLIEAINLSLDALQSGGAEKAISGAQNILSKSSDMHDDFEEVVETLNRAHIEISEAISSLQSISSSVDLDDENLEAIEERLFAMRSMAKKYNVDVDGLAGYCEQIREKLGLIENADIKLGQLEADLVEAKARYLEQAKSLTDARILAAKSLENALHKELAPLKMENTRLQVNIEAVDEDSWSAHGVDKVAFLASTNPGLPFAQLTKIASGGELSRFMLAMKVALSNVTSPPVMIFDEIDTGIGGAVADAVGKRLEKLGGKLQVMAITHQPQVAARANSHHKISKQQQEDNTFTNIVPLSIKQREEELARMLAGSKITGEARAAAAKLLGV